MEEKSNKIHLKIWVRMFFLECWWQISSSQVRNSSDISMQTSSNFFISPEQEEVEENGKAGIIVLLISPASMFLMWLKLLVLRRRDTKPTFLHSLRDNRSTQLEAQPLSDLWLDFYKIIFLIKQYVIIYI